MQAESMTVPPRLPLVVLPSNRSHSTNKDAKLVNCYIETDEQGEIQIYRRPGMLTFQTHSPPQEGTGAFYWDGDVYTVFGVTLYRNNASVGTLGTTGTAKNAFTSILGATPKMILGDGTQAYTYYVGGGLSADLHSINTEYPATTVYGFAYLNGEVSVMQPEAVVWTSKENSVDQVGDWDPLAFISAQAEPDNGIAIAKQLVYDIAFNEWTTEVFFDAGNPSGSPLGPVQGSLISYGCAAADSIQSIDDVLFWLSRNRTNSLQIAKMERLSLEIISTKAIDRLLVGADLSDVMSWQIKFDGHSFYVITLVSLNLTLAYDIVEGFWCQWTDQYGNYLNIVASTYDASGNNILQHKTDGTLLYMSTSYYTDDGAPIPVSIVTPTFDAQTRRRKQMNMMYFVADQVDGSVLQVRYSDDDYKSWSNWRTIDLSLDTPSASGWGTFKKRAYHLYHKQDTFFRISAVEIQYDIGSL